ncbi:MAG: DUF2851 family protein [Candidatus Hydrogenedens sp.]|nr:DUF2851 family protein [Candidatus Hydrogenedens sp.]
MRDDSAERYQRILDEGLPDCVRETSVPEISEMAVQALWYDQTLPEPELCSLEGHRIEVISPGFWNRQAGPDFLGAQLRFNGELHSGDVEVHLTAGGWRAHGHHVDPRYDGVILHVLLERGGGAPAVTSNGRRIPTLVLSQSRTMAGLAAFGEPEPCRNMDVGRCAALLPAQGSGPLISALKLAAEWRMLAKAKAFGMRMERVGANQAYYEAIMAACGYSAFKYQFQAVARHLPYERAVQLAQQDPLLLECALLQVGGLLPVQLETPGRVPHFERLCTLRKEHLAGLRPLPLAWPRGAMRPANAPERRLAGMARLLSRTAADGLHDALMRIWSEPVKPLDRRRAFEALFPRATGFWANHYTWAGKSVERPAAPIGMGRIHSIIGNVLVPAAWAESRALRDRELEERVAVFFEALPKEAGNHIVERMVPRLWGRHETPPRLNFQLQQGMLQFYHDWCEPNPSCRHCSMLRYLEQK